MKTSLFLLVIIMTSLAGNAQTFPMVVRNTPQSSAALSIRSSNSSSFTYLTSFDAGKKLVASSVVSGQTATGSNSHSTNKWYVVSLPGSSNFTSTTGYVAAGATFTNPECGAGYIQITYSTVNLRPSAGNTSTYVTVNGGSGRVYSGQRYAVTGTSLVNNVLWFRFDLPNNCSQKYGWVASYAGSTQLAQYYTSSTNGLPTPTSVSASNVSGTSADVDWAMSFYPSGSSSTYNTQFKIYRSTTLLATDNNSDLNTKYTLTGLSNCTNYQVYVKASLGNCVSSNSSTASFTTLNCCSAPTITSHPTNSSVTSPASTSFSVSASGGKTPYSYQWQLNSGSGWGNVPNSSPYSGVTSSTLNISSTNTGMSGNTYRCIVSSGSNCSSYSTNSNSATLTVSSGCSAPTITSHPTNSSVTSPAGTSYSVSANGGKTPYSYQWQLNSGSGWGNVPNSSPYSGVTSSTLNISSTNTGMSGNMYRCVVSSASPCGNYIATSNSAGLTVSLGTSNKPDLSIIGQSLSLTSTNAGSTITAYFAEENNGNASSVANIIGVYLSTDQSITPGINGDVLLATYSYTNSLAPSSQSIMLNQAITIPSNTVQGVYYVGIIADDNNSNSESNENNNDAIVQITITNTALTSIVPNAILSPVSSPNVTNPYIYQSPLCKPQPNPKSQPNWIPYSWSFWQRGTCFYTGHGPGEGVGKANDEYAWDCNNFGGDPNNPDVSWDKNKPVYAVENGVVMTGNDYAGWGGNTSGQLLIRHQAGNNIWFSSYLHLTNITNKKNVLLSEVARTITKREIIGYVSDVGATNYHLHFAVYQLDINNPQMLVSKNTIITPWYLQDNSLSAISLRDFKNLSIYPNPTTGIVQVEGIGDGDVDYRLVNGVGAVVKTGRITHANSQIDISPYPNGLYNLLLQTNNGVVVKKVQLLK